MSFSKAFTQLIEIEKGFSNHKADKGGATNWGITRATYEKWKGRPVTIQEMINMPKSDAQAIYKAWYWDAFRGDQLKSYPMAYSIFDQAVNSGVVVAVRRAQQVVGVTADGVMGPGTIAKLNSFAEPSFLNGFIDLTLANYKRIIDKDPSQKAFENGWKNRAAELKKYFIANMGTVNTASVSAVAVLTGLGIVFFLITSKAKA